MSENTEKNDDLKLEKRGALLLINTVDKNGESKFNKRQVNRIFEVFGDIGEYSNTTKD